MTKFIVYQGKERVYITTKKEEPAFLAALEELGEYLMEHDRKQINGLGVEIDASLDVTQGD